MARGQARGGGLRARVVEWLDLPPDLGSGAHRLTLLGTSRLILENHRGIIAYSPQCLVVGVARGQVEVRGEGLTVSRVHRDEVVVAGDIRSISFTC
ncbi:MAG: YabP/YqfC family sporulation protein [Acetobacteraceae bacterium]|nr:YabP/YqfC family sporulation protein [Acetobacteraceae bacterium]